MKYKIEGLTFETEKSQFGELDLISLLAEMREAKNPFLYNVGVGGSISSKPIIHKDTVFFGCCDKNFYAVDAKTGEEKWRFSTNGPNISWKLGLLDIPNTTSLLTGG